VPPQTGHAIRNVGTEPLVYVSAAAPPIDVSALDPVFAYNR
jgi:oxalate decarboxylase/phosphoglucose isomerase-like protein (cupin superfamily)